MITDRRAREIASSWYGGQWTSLYKIVCNEDYSKLSFEDWRGAAAEARREWEIAKTSGRLGDARSISILLFWIERCIQAKKSRDASFVDLKTVREALIDLWYDRQPEDLKKKYEASLDALDRLVERMESSDERMKKRIISS